ncbi:MAG: hypothetical protein NTY65_07265 [Planctomycetota bacterium]|nr:hypothetical protein [Planctomycetota bacterium]
MPQRAVNLVLVVAGVATVALLMVLGADLASAASRGPQWKRRMLGAGLALLMAMGFAPDLGRAAAEESKPAASAAPAASDKGLAEAKGWNRILAAWKEAEDIASGKRGDYPFDEAGKKRLLEDLKKAEADVADLQKAKLITAPEAGLLLKDLDTLTIGVHATLPTEAKNVTCYAPMPFQPGRDSFNRLSDRLPLLEKLAAAVTLHPEVVEKVLESIETDIQTLSKEESLKEFAKAEEREKAEKTRDAAKASALRLRQRITAPVMCYYLYLMSIPLREPESKQEQSVARLRILETPAATAALRPDVLHKAAANARTLENET